MIPVLLYPTRDHGLGEIDILLAHNGGDRLIIPSMHYMDLGALPSFSQVSKGLFNIMTVYMALSFP